MARLVHFEITGKDPGKLAQFYAKALEVHADPSPFLKGYHMLVGEGPLGAVMDRTYREQVAIVWFEVENLDAAVTRIIAEGGTVAGDQNTIPGEGLVQYVADPEGTIFGLKQPL
ncbi:VOC family protein [Pelagibacterium sp.]|uniref:VOC family protein n=1 Tax=Pelagibacterium sp. TaxID=1967288 RepID=UPI003BA94675